MRGPPEGAAGVTYAAGVEIVEELLLVVVLGLTVDEEGLEVVLGFEVLLLNFDVDLLLVVVVVEDFAVLVVFAVVVDFEVLVDFEVVELNFEEVVGFDVLVLELVFDVVGDEMEL